MRKQYETKEMLINERKIADELEKIWNVKLYKLNYVLKLDFAVVKENKIIGWVEIKSRTISSQHKPYYMIAMHKINAGIIMNEKTMLTFILVVKFIDGLFIYKYNKEHHFELVMDGRKATQRDWQDIEPCYHIPMKYFKQIEAKKQV